MIKKEKFDSICQELSKALSREQQAQELLNEQSSQLEELGMRLNLYTTEEIEKDATITEAVKVKISQTLTFLLSPAPRWKNFKLEVQLS